MLAYIFLWGIRGTYFIIRDVFPVSRNCVYNIMRIGRRQHYQKQWSPYSTEAILNWPTRFQYSFFICQHVSVICLAKQQRLKWTTTNNRASVNYLLNTQKLSKLKTKISAGWRLRGCPASDLVFKVVSGLMLWSMKGIPCSSFIFPLEHSSITPAIAKHLIYCALIVSCHGESPTTQVLGAWSSMWWYWQVVGP